LLRLDQFHVLSSSKRHISIALWKIIEISNTWDTVMQSVVSKLSYLFEPRVFNLTAAVSQNRGNYDYHWGDAIIRFYWVGLFLHPPCTFVTKTLHLQRIVERFGDNQYLGHWDAICSF